MDPNYQTLIILVDDIECYVIHFVRPAIKALSTQFTIRIRALRQDRCYLT